MVLALIAEALLVVPGTGLWANANWWKTVAVLGLTLSFGLMVLYFHPVVLFIQAVNAALIVGLLWLNWSCKSMLGA